MAEINLAKGKTMLLMADFTTSGIGQNPIAAGIRSKSIFWGRAGALTDDS